MNFYDHIQELNNQLKSNQITVAQFFHKLNINKYFKKLPLSDEIIIFQFNAIGDSILVSSFIREVKQNNLSKKITLVCNDTSNDLFEYCPYIDKLVPIKCVNKTLPDIIQDLINTFKDNFWKYKFALALCPQWGRPNFAASLGAYLVGAERSVGYNVNSWNTIKYFLYDKRNITSFNSLLCLDVFDQNCINTISQNEKVFIHFIKELVEIRN